MFNNTIGRYTKMIVKCYTIYTQGIPEMKLKIDINNLVMCVVYLKVIIIMY